MKSFFIALLVLGHVSGYATTALKLSYSSDPGTIQKALFYVLKSEFDRGNSSSIKYNKRNKDYILQGEQEYPVIKCRKKFIRKMSIPSFRCILEWPGNSKKWFVEESVPGILYKLLADNISDLSNEHNDLKGVFSKLRRNKSIRLQAVDSNGFSFTCERKQSAPKFRCYW